MKEARSEKPRLLVLTSTFPRWKGDCEPRFVFDLSRHLTGEFEVHVLAPHALGSALYEQLEGVHVHRFRYAPERFETLTYQGGILARLKERRARAMLIPLFLLAEIFAIRRFLRRHRVAVIHSHWIVPQTLAVCLARLGTQWATVPVVCTSHGGDLFGLRGRLFEALKAWILRCCDYVTVVSHAMREKMQRLVPERNPDVIPMGTNLTELFTPRGTGRVPDTILFVGRFVEKKGVSHLLKAIRIVREGRPGVRLLLAGSGPEEERLRELSKALGLESSVSFLGPVTHGELPHLYREAAVAVVPSVVEGFGLVIVEAMGCGCPVIVSDLPAVHDIVYGPDVALLVPPGDGAGLARAINAVLDDPRGAAARAKLAREHVLRYFDWNVVASRYAAQLKQAGEVHRKGAQYE